MVTREIEELLDGKNPNTGFPSTVADVLVGRFIAGHLLMVSLASAEDVDLERLEDVDEVWAICFRKPRPGWRILGRFMESGVFVGLHAYHRNFLGRRSHYTKVAERIPEEWEKLLPGLQPFRGPSIGEYLGGGVWRNVDEKI